jgi:hypothetical protein
VQIASVLHTTFIGSASFLHTWEIGCSDWLWAILGGTGCRQLGGRVMAMQRYLLVLDMLALDEELDQGPISYLVGQQEQQPCNVVVLSLVATRQAKLSTLELVLGAATAHGHSAPAKFPGAPQPGHDISAAAEHRMTLAVRRLKAIGCQASGLISDQELLKAVRAEIRAHDYDKVILATGCDGGTRVARGLRLDPIHQLRRHLGQRLVIFAADMGTKPKQ